MTTLFIGSHLVPSIVKKETREPFSPPDCRRRAAYQLRDGWRFERAQSGSEAKAMTEERCAELV
jgi:hypothetical protein